MRGLAVADLTRNQRFAIGCVISAVAIAFAFWAFHKGCLEGVQPQIVQVLLPLAAGFAAWSFSGTIRIHATEMGLLPKAAVVATGGFAVWLATAYMLIPRSDETCKKQSISARERLIEAVAGIRSIRGDYAFSLTGDQQAARKVIANAPAQIAKLVAVESAALTQVERIHRSANIARGHLYFGLAWQSTESNVQKAIDAAEASIKWSSRALEEIEPLWKSDATPGNALSAHASAQIAWLKAQRYDEFVSQILGRAHLLSYRCGRPDYAQAVAAFARVSRSYRHDEGLMSEPLIRWFCEKHPAEATVCS